MIISFDLDDTLFVNPAVTPTETAPKFPYNRIYPDRLRLGAVELLSRIRDSGIKLWIYTSSFRSEKYITSYFKRYGIKIDHVINGQRHAREVQGDKKEPLPSKYPSRYRIALHVDDDVSVAQNGRAYGFRVFLLKADHPDWVENLWNKIQQVKKLTP